MKNLKLRRLCSPLDIIVIGPGKCFMVSYNQTVGKRIQFNVAQHGIFSNVDSEMDFPGNMGCLFIQQYGSGEPLDWSMEGREKFDKISLFVGDTVVTYAKFLVALKNAMKGECLNFFCS